jgi:hypothetical protein
MRGALSLEVKMNVKSLLTLLIALLVPSASARAQYFYVQIVSLCEEEGSAIDPDGTMLPDFVIDGLHSNHGPFREAKCIVDSRNYRGRPILGPRSLRGRESLDVSITVLDDDGGHGDDTVDVNPSLQRRNIRLRLSRNGGEWELRNRDTNERLPLSYGITDEDRSRLIETAGQPDAPKRARLRYRAWVQEERF